MAERLPAKFANNLKINYANIIDKPPNPLFPSISRNPMPRENFQSKAKLSSPRESKPTGNQTIASPVIPFDRLVMKQSGESKSIQLDLKSIHPLKRTCQHAQALSKAYVLTRRTSSYGRMALAFGMHSNYIHERKSVKEIKL